MALISLKNLCMSYEGKKVITNLNLDILEKDYLCIVGENGTGKTTLLKGLLGFKKVDSGEIVLSKELGRGKIGYLAQQTPVQKDFPASVREIVLSGTLPHCKLRPFYSKKDKKRAQDAMEMLEISHLCEKCYHNLSGGQQQRVLLARAICASKKLLILDEPITGLDSIGANEFYELIKKLNNDGVTIIMITHDISRVIENAGHVLHIGHQKILFYGEGKDYKIAAQRDGFWEKSL